MISRPRRGGSGERRGDDRPGDTFMTRLRAVSECGQPNASQESHLFLLVVHLTVSLIRRTLCYIDTRGRSSRLALDSVERLGLTGGCMRRFDARCTRVSRSTLSPPAQI